MNRSSASLFLPMVILLAIGAAVYTKPWHNNSVGNSPRLPTPALNVPRPSASSGTPAAHPSPASSINREEEATFAEQWMASEITGLEQGHVNAKLVSNVRCTRATAWPRTFAGDPGHAYDCTATFTNSPATQRWCALYDSNQSQLITYYQGAKMCEGRPNPTIEP